MTEYCVDLAAVRRDDLAAVGGKAANLGELISCGFDVPPGFVVTTAAYQRSARGAQSSEQVQALEVPDEVADAIARAYEALGAGAVAVRSSATAEDLPGATFAGQHDTYLDVDGADAVVAAVQDCWASLWSDRAVAYRQRLAIDPASVAMGVVVQRMVPAESAGVMFTADPVTGARDRVVINAGEGLGEAIVSGQVTPEHLVVTADGQVVERQRGHDDNSAGRMVLTDAHAVALARTGRQIAQQFATPQDIEWASRDGRFSIVQSRPMTRLPPAPVPLNRFQRLIGPVLVELMPRRPYPMELTAWILPTIARHVDEMIAGLTGMRVSLAASIPATDAVVQEFVPPQPNPSLSTPVRLARTLGRGLSRSAEQWTSDPRLRSYRSEAEALDALDLQQLSWEDLTAVPRRASRLVDLVTALRVAYLPGAFVGLARLVVALKVTRRGQLAQELIGSAPTMTTAANDALAELARTTAQAPQLRKLLASGELDRVLGEAPTLPEAGEWWGDFQQFLQTYGHRETTSVLLVRDPTWRDSPRTVLGLVRVLLGDSTSPRSARGLSTPTRKAVSSRWIRRLAEKAAAGVACREDTHFELTRTMPTVHRAINEAGRRLAEAGVLDDPQGVWMLTLDELTTWAPGSGTDQATRGLRARVARRTAAYDELARSPLIATTTLYPHREGSDAALVVGTPGGGGRTTGPVRLIGGPDEFATLRSGDVLVCATTNPSWTPLFQRAAAVVVDHGGIGSHAAIVAREYGIPAVLGTGTGTSTLGDGQAVTVDGDLGEVLAAEAPS